MCTAAREETLTGTKLDLRMVAAALASAIAARPSEPNPAFASANGRIYSSVSSPDRTSSRACATTMRRVPWTVWNATHTLSVVCCIIIRGLVFSIFRAVLFAPTLERTLQRAHKLAHLAALGNWRNGNPPAWLLSVRLSAKFLAVVILEFARFELILGKIVNQSLWNLSSHAPTCARAKPYQADQRRFSVGPVLFSQLIAPTGRSSNRRWRRLPKPAVDFGEQIWPSAASKSSGWAATRLWASAPSFKTMGPRSFTPVNAWHLNLRSKGQ